MEVLARYFIKILKRSKLIKFFNFYLYKTINGVKVKIPFINGMGITNFFQNTDWLDILIKQLVKKDSSAFVDVGTNIGQTYLKLKTLHPELEYIGFEPNSSCVSYMQQLINANSYTNSIIHNCALSSSVQIILIEKTLLDDVRASIVPSLRPHFFENKEHIITLNYDFFFPDQDISFVKIDVEGAELDVIKGMKSSIHKYKPIIFCEVLDFHQTSVYEFAQLRATTLSKLLSDLDYSIIRIETSMENHNITSLRKISEIKLQQWTPNSLNVNDYLFYPTTKEHELFSELSKICNTISQ